MDSKAQNSKDKQKQEAKKAIEKYFHQLTVGCGSNECTNPYCQSSGLVDRSLTPNQAAIKAIQLFNQVINTNNPSQQCPSTTKNIIDDVDMQEVPKKW